MRWFAPQRMDYDPGEPNGGEKNRDRPNHPGRSIDLYFWAAHYRSQTLYRGVPCIPVERISRPAPHERKRNLYRRRLCSVIAKSSHRSARPPVCTGLN